MTDIAADDKREAREWLRLTASYTGTTRHKHARTILALLDRPRMPKPEDVPPKVYFAMGEAHNEHDDRITANLFAYRALYDHYNPPPAPARVEAWAIKSANGELDGTFVQKSDAERYLQRASGSRIVRLVEADSHE